MGVEIERKFRVQDTGFLAGSTGEQLVQGYLAKTGRVTVRVRLAGEQAWITVKGATHGISRAEFEYPMPAADADYCLRELCEGPVIRKTRHRVPHAGHVWEVDVFDGENAGLVLAEIELGSEDEPFERPAWIGAEVSLDPRFFNSALARHPFANWSAAERAA